MNQTKNESSDKSSHKNSNSYKKISETNVNTAKKHNQIKINQNVTLTNTSHKKFKQNIPLVNIKKQIFSSSVVTPAVNSPLANSKIKKKPPVVNKKDSSKNSFSIGNTNNETNLYSLSTTARKKNSSSETINANKPVSKFILGNSFKSTCSNDCTKYIELMNKLKGLCSLQSTNDIYLLKDFVLNIESPSKKDKKLSRNNSDNLYTPNKKKIPMEEKKKIEIIFSEIEKILKSANKAKHNSLIQNKENTSENHFNLNSKLKLESDSRILFYKKLFRICSEKLTEISDIILNSYEDCVNCTPPKNEKFVEKSNGKSQYNNYLETESMESIFNEGTTTAHLPSSKIVSVNLPKEHKEEYKTNDSEKTTVDKMHEIDYTLLKERFQRKRNNKIEEKAGSKEKNCNIF